MVREEPQVDFPAMRRMPFIESTATPSMEGNFDPEQFFDQSSLSTFVFMLDQALSFG